MRRSLGVVIGLAVVGMCALLVPWADLDDIPSWPRGDRLAGLGILLGFAFTAAQTGPSWWEGPKSQAANSQSPAGQPPNDARGAPMERAYATI